MKKLLGDFGGRKFVMVGLTLFGSFAVKGWVLTHPGLVDSVTDFTDNAFDFDIWLAGLYITGNVAKAATPLIQKIGGQDTK